MTHRQPWPIRNAGASRRRCLAIRPLTPLDASSLALRKVGGGCDVPHDPLVPLGADQADRLVKAVQSLKPEGDAALVDSIKTAADDLPADADAQNTIILVSAGEDTCLTKQQKDPCTAMAAVADSLNRAGIKFTLHIVALRANEAARQQLTCLARANASGYVYQANSVEDLKEALSQIEQQAAPPQIAESWPSSQTIDYPRQIYGLRWLPDGKHISANTDREVLAWDLAANQVLTESVANGPSTAAWSFDGKRMAFLGGAGTIVVWDSSSNIVLKSDVPGKDSGAYTLSWSPDGQKIAAGSLDGDVPIWDVASQTAVRLPGHKGAVFKVAWSPDGQHVASGGGDGTVRIWNVQSGQAVQVIQDNCCSVSGLAWSPDSRQIASASGTLVHIWEAATGQPLATINTLSGVNKLRWSPDGAYLVNNGLEIIDMRRYENLGSLIDPASHVASSDVAWSPDGTQLAVSAVKLDANGSQYSIRVWKVPAVSR